MAKNTALKLTFDLSDQKPLVDALRLYAVQNGKSQKEVVVEALEAYMAHRMENQALWSAAERTFGEWDNPEDEVYNGL